MYVSAYAFSLVYAYRNCSRAINYVSLSNMITIIISVSVCTDSNEKKEEDGSATHNPDQKNRIDNKQSLVWK